MCGSHKDTKGHGGKEQQRHEIYTEEREKKGTEMQRKKRAFFFWYDLFQSCAHAKKNIVLHFSISAAVKAVSSSQINTDSSSFLVCVCFRGSQFQYYIACHGLTFFLKDGHYPHTHDAPEIIQIVKAL